MSIRNELSLIRFRARCFGFRDDGQPFHFLFRLPADVSGPVPDVLAPLPCFYAEIAHCARLTIDARDQMARENRIAAINITNAVDTVFDRPNLI